MPIRGEPPSSRRWGLGDRGEDALWAEVRAQLRLVRAPESLRARIEAMLSVERGLVE